MKIAIRWTFSLLRCTDLGADRLRPHSTLPPEEFSVRWAYEKTCLDLDSAFRRSSVRADRCASRLLRPRRNAFAGIWTWCYQLAIGEHPWLHGFGLLYRDNDFSSRPESRRPRYAVIESIYRNDVDFSQSRLLDILGSGRSWIRRDDERRRRSSHMHHSAQLLCNSD